MVLITAPFKLKYLGVRCMQDSPNIVAENSGNKDFSFVIVHKHTTNHLRNKLEHSEKNTARFPQKSLENSGH